ncbi:MAG: serine hydrolase domain-containing protein [Thermoanaerobaculia bacterium]
MSARAMEGVDGVDGVGGIGGIDGELSAARLPRTFAELSAQLNAGLALGGQICVLHDDGVVADAGFGFARPGEPMRRDHLMLWMSSSKPVAAIAICQLWERGRLDLDDPVALHIPEFARGGKSTVTIRHLLTHTGGIRMLDTGWPAAGWDAIVARVSAQRLEPRWEPGRKAGYHLASSWFILGELVRRLDGRPFETYVREEIFLPLGCTDCWIGMPIESYRSYGRRIAPMFDVASADHGVPALKENSTTSEERLVVPSPGGNGCGPIRELAQIYRMLAAHGAFGGHRFLQPQTVDALAARHRVGMIDLTFRAKLDWGLGVIVNSAHYGEAVVPYGYGAHAGPRTFGHSGARSSTAFLDPEAGLVVALAVNGMAPDEVHRQRFERLTTAVYEDLGLAAPGTATLEAGEPDAGEPDAESAARAPEAGASSASFLS